MSKDEFKNLGDKIYKTTCEIEDLIELKEIIIDNRETYIFKDKASRKDKEIEKTKTFTFRRAMWYNEYRGDDIWKYLISIMYVLDFMQ